MVINVCAMLRDIPDLGTDAIAFLIARFSDVPYTQFRNLRLSEVWRDGEKAWVQVPSPDEASTFVVKVKSHLIVEMVFEVVVCPIFAHQSKAFDNLQPVFTMCFCSTTHQFASCIIVWAFGGTLIDFVVDNHIHNLQTKFVCHLCSTSHGFHFGITMQIFMVELRYWHDQ